MTRAGRRARRAGHAWRVALVFSLFWLGDSFAREVQESAANPWYPEVYDQTFRPDLGPAFIVDPWLDHDESEDDPGCESDEQDEEVGDDRKRVCAAPPAGPGLFLSAPDTPQACSARRAADDPVPPGPSQRALLHFLQLLLI